MKNPGNPKPGNPVMSRELQLTSIRRWMAERSIPTDIIDLESIIDPTLTLTENWDHIKRLLKTMGRWKEEETVKEVREELEEFETTERDLVREEVRDAVTDAIGLELLTIRERLEAEAKRAAELAARKAIEEVPREVSPITRGVETELRRLVDEFKSLSKEVEVYRQSDVETEETFRTKIFEEIERMRKRLERMEEKELKPIAEAVGITPIEIPIGPLIEAELPPTDERIARLAAMAAQRGLIVYPIYVFPKDETKYKASLTLRVCRAPRDIQELRKELYGKHIETVWYDKEFMERMDYIIRREIETASPTKKRGELYEAYTHYCPPDQRKVSGGWTVYHVLHDLRDRDMIKDFDLDALGISEEDFNWLVKFWIKEVGPIMPFDLWRRKFHRPGSQTEQF